MSPEEQAAQAALMEAEFANISFGATAALRGGSKSTTTDLGETRARLHNYMTNANSEGTNCFADHSHNHRYDTGTASASTSASASVSAFAGAPAVQAPAEQQQQPFAPKLYQPGRHFVNEFASSTLRKNRPRTKKPNNINNYPAFKPTNVFGAGRSDTRLNSILRTPPGQRSRSRIGIVAPAFGGLVHSRYANPQARITADLGLTEKRAKPVDKVAEAKTTGQAEGKDDIVWESIVESNGAVTLL